VLAFGHFNELQALLQAELPGRLSISPLVTEGGDLNPESPMVGQQAAVLTTDPGFEIHAVGRMAAALAPAIKKGAAAVDLNHYLPWGGDTAAPDGHPRRLRLSERARGLADGIRPWLRSRAVNWAGGPPSVAVLDSGLDPSLVTLNRDHRFFDYSDGGRMVTGSPEVDPVGHGTRVIKILDEVLPDAVTLSIGRLPPGGDSLTVLTVARAYADLIARTSPTVINLSIAPRDDVIFCPRCRLPVPAPTLAQTALSSLFRLSSSVTFTVMAAGNQGQIPNSRWVRKDLDGLIFAVAEDSTGKRASYSGAPDGPDADLWSCSAFGGDGPGEGASGVFEGEPESYGTSFSAPFVTCIAVGQWQDSKKGPGHRLTREDVAMASWRPRFRQVFTADGMRLMPI